MMYMIYLYRLVSIDDTSAGPEPVLQPGKQRKMWWANSSKRREILTVQNAFFWERYRAYRRGNRRTYLLRARPGVIFTNVYDYVTSTQNTNVTHDMRSKAFSRYGPDVVYNVAFNAVTPLEFRLLTRRRCVPSLIQRQYRAVQSKG